MYQWAVSLASDVLTRHVSDSLYNQGVVEVSVAAFITLLAFLTVTNIVGRLQHIGLQFVLLLLSTAFAWYLCIEAWNALGHIQQPKESGISPYEEFSVATEDYIPGFLHFLRTKRSVAADLIGMDEVVEDAEPVSWLARMAAIAGR
jgi:hypothetical protein